MTIEDRRTRHAIANLRRDLTMFWLLLLTDTLAIFALMFVFLFRS